MPFEFRNAILIAAVSLLVAAIPGNNQAQGKFDSKLLTDGHFEFVNLMPGEYLLYTEFRFEHGYIQSEVVGYTNHYINGMFQGTSANTVNRDYSVGTSATVKKVVTVSKARDKVEVKLKKTHA